VIADKIAVKDFNQVLNYLIFFALAVIVGGVVYTQADFGTNTKKIFSFGGEENKKNLPQVEMNQVVNKYLKQASIENLRQEVIAEKTLAETRAQLKRLEEERRRKELKEIANIPLERQVWKSEVSDGDVFLPKPAQNSSEELSPEEYARQFKENARKAGYEIELSSDMQVINYRRIDGGGSQPISIAPSAVSVGTATNTSDEESPDEERPAPAPKAKKSSPPPRSKASAAKTPSRGSADRADIDRDVADRDAESYSDDPAQLREKDPEERVTKDRDRDRDRESNAAVEPID